MGRYRPSDREMLIGALGGECDECGDADPDAEYERRESGFEVHHIDGDTRNNARENLRLLCVACHRRLHGGGDVGYRDEATLRKMARAGETVQSIADHFNVSTTTVLNYCGEYAIDVDYS